MARNNKFKSGPLNMPELPDMPDPASDDSPYEGDYDPDAARKVEAPPPDGPPPVEARDPLRKFCVSLDASTPLAHRTLVVEAHGVEHARRLFCLANGISGSDLTWKIDEAADDAEVS